MNQETPRTPEEELNHRKFEYLMLRLDVENVSHGDMENFDYAMGCFWRYFGIDPAEQLDSAIEFLKKSQKGNG